MADDEETARQEKLAAARKRFEEIKKDKKPSKKKGGARKEKTESEVGSATASDAAPERTDSPATVETGTETPPPPEEGIAVVEKVDDAAGATTSHEDEEQGADENAKAENDSAAVIAELRSRVSALELENTALKDSLATANAKIQLDASTISSLQAQLPISPPTGETVMQTPPPMSPSKREEYYRVLEEKFSREAQERYLLERDYASLARTHDKLVSAHNAVVAELERLKMRFSAEEKRRQMSESGEEYAIDEKQALAARERAANINARISAGTSSFFRTAQGFSAAVVKGVTGGASAVIDGGAPAMMRRASSNSKTGRIRASSSASYADVDLYADDGDLGEDEEEDDEASYQRGLERARLAAAAQKEKEAKEDANAKRLQWFKNEMEKWKGFQLDLAKAGGSPIGAGPIFEV
ncbi:hypothetical protein V1509DRAFT_625988 [Lipomyces kononenkoae]